MFGEYSDAQWVAVAFVYLGIILILALTVRRLVPVLGRLFIPASVIAGFLLLFVGPQMLGEWTGTAGLIPAEVMEVLARLPGILINIVFAGIMIGKTLPSMRKMWQESAPHVILGSVYSFGQFALGAFAVVFILTPFFGLPDAAGSILELAFAGGHGTIAGMGGLLVDAGAEEVVDIGLGLATISMVTGVVGGSILVNYGIRNPKISVARTDPITESPASMTEIALNSGDQKEDDNAGLGAFSRSFGAIMIAITIGILILWVLRTVTGALGSDVFESFPLFPFTVIGGFIVQLVLTKRKAEHLVERRSVNDIMSLSLDLLIASAIGTMSLAALGANIPTLLILTVIAVAWSVVGLLWLGPKIHNNHWFERGIADYGQSQGNVATGFVLADMVDPEGKTGASRGYGYKQLTYEPFLGGGLITAFSVPLIMQIGSLWFGVLSLVITVLLIVWGIVRNRRNVSV